LLSTLTLVALPTYIDDDLYHWDTYCYHYLAGRNPIFLWKKVGQKASRQLMTAAANKALIGLSTTVVPSWLSKYKLSCLNDIIKLKASMKLRSASLLFFILLISVLPAVAKRCTGSAYCTACTNCSRCAHCGAGGSCGVCSGRGSEEVQYSSPPKSPQRNTENNSDAYTRQHLAEQDLQVHEVERPSTIHNDYSTTTNTTESESKFSFFWFLVIVCVLYFLFRKKK